MNQALSNYLKGMLTNEEVIEELLKIAAEIKRTEEEGNELSLNMEEKAFYDALSSPEGIKEAYSNEQFLALTKALTEKLRENRTIDWNKKDSARASMRRIIKRLLREYHYPPEGYDQALTTVMRQCEKWADDEENFEVSAPRLADVEDDQEVRNLIFNRLQLDDSTSDLQLQREVIEVFGERYPGMTANDWRHIIEDYTPMIRNASKAREVSLQEYKMAAEENILYKIVLTDEELNELRLALKGKIGFMGSGKDGAILMRVIDKAEKLMHELDAYDESGDDLLYWYYTKYKEQNGIIEDDIRPKGPRYFVD